MPLPRLFCLLLMHGWIAANAQPGDTIRTGCARNKQRYFTATILTGAGGLFFPRQDGVLEMTMPYSYTDGQGGNNDSIFHSGLHRPYGGNTRVLLPFSFEGGNLNHFFTVGIAFSFIGGYTGGMMFSAGYGRNYYIGPLVIKPSVNIVYTEDDGYNSAGRLGSIDNRGRTIQMLDEKANPTYQHAVDYYFWESVRTYNAGNLDVLFSQREWSFMPRIALTTNQYTHKYRLDLVVGCNFPFHDKGGIMLVQDLGSSHGNQVGFTNMNDGRVTTRYNGRVITRTPFRFPGLYVSLACTFVGGRRAH